jgi:hypothetical protein
MVKICKIVLLIVCIGFLPFFAHAADLYLTPPSATFEVGDSITIQVVVSSNSPINAVSSSILFPPSIFSIDSVSKVGSILNFWTTEPSFSKTTGVVTLEGVSLGGFLGTTGNVATIRLRAMKSGVGKITFQSGQILANDGKGTDITVNLTGSNLNIDEMVVKPKPVVPVKEVEEEIVVPKPVEEIPSNQNIIPTPILVSPELSFVTIYGGIAILILLLVLIMIIMYLSWKILQSSPKHFSKKVRNEVDETAGIVHKSFDILRDDVKGSKSADIKKDLNDAEDLITRKIKDIESL